MTTTAQDTPSPLPSRTARIRATARHDRAAAERMLQDFIAGLFDIPVTDLAINVDRYSLNSLNGTFRSGGRRLFFKFHQEEGEEEMTGEYYRADLLTRAGLPVDQPVHLSTLPGEQLLVYRHRDDPRFSDVLFALDQSPDSVAEDAAVAAEARLNDALLRVAQDTLHPITPAQSAAEPIHRLFHERLSDPDGTYPGGRLGSFYAGKSFDFPGLTLTWDQIADAQPVLNGQPHTLSLRALFDRAQTRLAPARLADAGGVTAHGDAHNANVWYETAGDAPHLAFFDPAFAGDHVPALLAEVKSTFHNCLAHPFWLYTPEIAEARHSATVHLSDGQLHIDTDWQLSPLRQRLLDTKADHFWRPFLADLAARDMLPPNWEDVIRTALFLCPTLVMNLRAGEGAHNPTSSAIGLATALAAGSPPTSGRDRMSDFFDRIRPA